MVASQNGHTEAVKLLLEKRAEVDAPKNDGATPLLIVSQKGHEFVVRLLLERKVDPGLEVRTPNGRRLRAADLACGYGHKRIAALLSQSRCG